MAVEEAGRPARGVCALWAGGVQQDVAMVQAARAPGSVGAPAGCSRPCLLAALVQPATHPCQQQQHAPAPQVLTHHLPRLPPLQHAAAGRTRGRAGAGTAAGGSRAYKRCTNVHVDVQTLLCIRACGTRRLWYCVRPAAAGCTAGDRELPLPLSSRPPPVPCTLACPHVRPAPPLHQRWTARPPHPHPPPTHPPTHPPPSLPCSVRR